MYCSSCGNRIPEGQGKSCSMCYGDVNYGKDGYYRDYLEQQEQFADDFDRMMSEQEERDLQTRIIEDF